ncbi:SLOG family protein [Mucilaginibacter glaciei]|uniref:DUF2493 domain-containing protein n=1 Tax=Mucilaginibacter glaciei TaxID=2772109 RepID=A0A926NPK0_9SPHI|nr:SLOG family protein [Mucilaginibacter glaciei]MBD1393048.1 hypothetical protein [Mucilaginibacter glaciei]
MKYFNLIIAGGRDFFDYALLKDSVSDLLADKVAEFEIVIVSSTVRGGDMLGEAYACEFGYEVAEFPYDHVEGDMVECYCNSQMLKFADACICFWDGMSKGTKQLIDLATASQLPLRVISY